MTPSSILESFSDDATADELKGFIRDLNEDEQASLVALAWIGRGSFGPDELDEALSTARAERTNRTEDYLIGMPLLPDYLEEALDRLGYSVEDAEDESLSSAALVANDRGYVDVLRSLSHCNTSLA